MDPFLVGIFATAFTWRLGRLTLAHHAVRVAERRSRHARDVRRMRARQRALEREVLD